jgi:hypothetical protein
VGESLGEVDFLSVVGAPDERAMDGSRWSSAPAAPLSTARTPRLRSTSSSPACSAERACRATLPGPSRLQ